MTVYDPLAHTAQEWRDKAQECLRAERESFERCDTDGALSQWGLTKLAQQYHTLADLAERGGVWEFRLLADLDNKVLDAEQVKGQFEWVWRIWDPDTRKVSWFHESEAKKAATRRANNAKKGYKYVIVRQAAVYVPGKGIVRKDGTRGVIIDTDYLGEDD